MDLKLQRKWLKQYKELFGNLIYVNSCRQKITDNHRYSNETNLAFGIGNTDADFVFIGKNFCKADGFINNSQLVKVRELFDKILGAIGLSKDNVYILNILKDSIYSNRNIKLEKFEPYFANQIKLIKPKLIIALGENALNMLIKSSIPFNKIREQILRYKTIDVITTYHPADLIKNPNLKRLVWEDFKKIKENYILE